MISDNRILKQICGTEALEHWFEDSRLCFSFTVHRTYDIHDRETDICKFYEVMKRIVDEGMSNLIAVDYQLAYIDSVVFSGGCITALCHCDGEGRFHAHRVLDGLLKREKNGFHLKRLYYDRIPFAITLKP